MFTLTGIIVLVLGFVVLVLTFMWIANLRSGVRRVAAKEADEEKAPSGRALMIHGANYGLVLGILSCLLFMISPLLLIMSLAGMFYGGRALWQGLSQYSIIVYRALIGAVLSLASVALHFLNATGQLPAILQVW